MVIILFSCRNKFEVISYVYHKHNSPGNGIGQTVLIDQSIEGNRNGNE